MSDCRTAKKDAERLVNEFEGYAYLSPSSFQRDNAKQCALICVKNIIKEFDLFQKTGIIHYQIKYWQEVEKEIAQL